MGEWRDLAGLEAPRIEGCCYSIDDYGNVEFLSGYPSPDKLEEIFEEAREHEKKCAESREKVLEWQYKLMEINSRNKKIDSYSLVFYLVAAVLVLLNLR